MKRLSGELQLALYFLAGVIIMLVGVTALLGWPGLLIGLGAYICAATIWVGQ